MLYHDKRSHGDMMTQQKPPQEFYCKRGFHFVRTEGPSGLARKRHEVRMFRVLILAALIWPLLACHDRTPTASEPATPTPLRDTPPMPGEAIHAGLDKDSLTQLLQANLEERWQQPRAAGPRYLTQAQQHRDRTLAVHAWQAAQQAGDGSLMLEALTLWRTLFDQAIAANSYTFTTADQLIMHRLCEQALQAQHWSEALLWQLTLDRYGDHSAVDNMLETWLTAEHPLPRTELYAQVAAFKAQYPEYHNAAIIKAALLAGEGRRQEALQQVKQVLQRSPYHLDALFTKALIEQQLHLTNGALQTVQTALSHGGLHEYRFILLRIDIELNARQNASADRHITEFVQQLPGSALAVNELAQFLLDHHHAEASLRLLKRAPLTADEAHNEEISSTRQALIGIAADQLDDDKQALNAFYHVTPASTLFPHAQLRLLTLTQERQGNEVASQLMSAQRKRFPDQILLLVQLELSALQQAHQTARATELLEQIVNEHPEHDGLRYLRAMQRMALHQTLAALEDLQQLSQHQPDNPIFLNAYGYMLADERQDYAQALPLLQKANALAPNNAEIQDSLGWTLYGLKQYEQACQWLEKAYTALPSTDISLHYLHVLMAVHDEHRAQQVLDYLYQSTALDQSTRDMLRTQYPTLTPSASH